MDRLPKIIIMEELTPLNEAKSIEQQQNQIQEKLKKAVENNTLFPLEDDK